MNKKLVLTFKGLSSEIVIQILHCCEYPTILRFAATCKAYRELVGYCTSLQLHIELEANGLELVKGSFQGDATYLKILEDLKRFREAWWELDLGDPVVRSVGQHTTLCWKVQEGYFIQAFSQSKGRHADALQFISLDLETPDLSPLLFDSPFDNFAVDPGQELLACVSRNLGLFTTLYIDLRSTVTGLAHSFAQWPRLIADFAFERPFFSPTVSVEIMGNMLLTSISHVRLHAYEILIWDWTSGNALRRITSRQGICDFSFLDQRRLVILSATRFEPHREGLRCLELLIYDLFDGLTTRSDISQGQLRVNDMVASRPRLRLAFPPIQESVMISETRFSLQSDPSPGRVLFKRSAAFACSYAKTLSLNFGFRKINVGWEFPDYYLVFLDGRFLLNQLLRTSPDTEAPIIPWISWGAQSTRWFLHSSRSDLCKCRMSNSRYIHRLFPEPYSYILDFSSLNWGYNSSSHLTDLLDTAKNFAPTGKFEDQGQSEGEFDRIFMNNLKGLELFVSTVGTDNPSIINPLGFEETIISQLPYRIACRNRQQLGDEEWQIDGDSIVGITKQGRSLENIAIYKLDK